MTLKLLFIIISTFVTLKANAQIEGYEQYNSFELCFKLDNLDQALIPELFKVSYYGSFTDTKNYIIAVKKLKVSQTIDINHQIKTINVWTRKANKGFLYVNQCIMDYCSKHGYHYDQIKISYSLDNRPVTTQKDVMDMVRLKKRKSLSVSFSTIDDPTRTIVVLIKS